MNIHEAKEQIKNAVTAYLTKDDLGRYVIPPQKQRPIFLMGPPGVGKTAIMEQVASELGIGLLSYSMTHHTRQSALGLPLIKHVLRTRKVRGFDICEISPRFDQDNTTANLGAVIIFAVVNTLCRLNGLSI